MFSQVPQIYGERARKEDPGPQFEAFSFTADSEVRTGTRFVPFSFTAGKEVRTGTRFVPFSFTAADEIRTGIIEEKPKNQREGEAPGRKGKFRRRRER